MCIGDGSIPVVAAPDRTSRLLVATFQKGITICAGTNRE